MRALMTLMALLALPALAQPTFQPAQRVTPNGPVEGQKEPRLSAGATEFLAVWSSGVGGRSVIRGARVGLDGASLDPAGFTIASAPGGQFEPSVTFGHGVYVVAWSDMRSGDHAVYAARVSAQGTVLDPGGVLLSTEATPARMPDVVATAQGFLAVWAQGEASQHGFVARARRLGTDVQPVDAQPLHLNDVGPWTSGEDFKHLNGADAACQHPRVAVQGNGALVVWEGTTSRQQGRFIVRAILDLTTGTQPVPPAVLVVGAQSRLYRTSVCGFGEGFLYAWTDPRERGGQGLDAANAGRLVLDGGVPASNAYDALKDPPGARIVWAPAVAPNGLVAFIDPSPDPQSGQKPEYHLVLRHVRPDGTSPGADVLVAKEAAWPALATHASGITLLVATVVNGGPAQARLEARLVSPP